jgi:copper transport protein
METGKMSMRHTVWISSLFSLGRFAMPWRFVLVAILVPMSFLLLFPATASAHAVLLRSDPSQDAVLHVPPDQVRLWFSEALNPAFSAVSVENAASQQRVDQHDAQLASGNSAELDVSLQPHLPPAVYIVIWRSDSNDDGHIEAGSFLFTVARPDGTIPKIPAGATTEGNGSNGGTTANLLTVFNLFMVTLLEVGIVFWVGAHIWFVFVLSATTAVGEDEEAEAISQQVADRFARHFAVLTLLGMLLANSGVLLGQALGTTGGQWATAFDPTLLLRLVTSSTFGLFWLLRELILLLALRLAWYLKSFQFRTPRTSAVLEWVNLALGWTLLTTMALSSHAAALTTPLVTWAVIADWLHLLAAAFWVGGMMVIAVLYLPILTSRSIAERSRSLLLVLPSYTPWAIAGVMIMAITGPFSATVQLNSWQQLLTTLYGQVLTIKILLVGLLLISSAFHVFFLRPRLKRAYNKYSRIATRSQRYLNSSEAPRLTTLSDKITMIREQRLARQARQLMWIVRWEPVVGVAVLLCVGLMNVFAGTLAPVAPTSASQQQQQSIASQQPFHATMQTFDHEFTVMLSISPNQQGSNVFTVSIANPRTNKPITHVRVDVNTEMLDQNLGIGFLPLKPDGHGHFSGRGDLVLSGHWQIIVQITTPNDPYHPHEAYTTLFTP